MTILVIPTVRFLAHRMTTSTRDKKRDRRAMRHHAAKIKSSLPERAATWRKRARNG